jgi:hypothetical protein
MREASIPTVSRCFKSFKKQPCCAGHHAPHILTGQDFAIKILRYKCMMARAAGKVHTTTLIIPCLTVCCKELFHALYQAANLASEDLQTNVAILAQSMDPRSTTVSMQDAFEASPGVKEGSRGRISVMSTFEKCTRAPRTREQIHRRPPRHSQMMISQRHQALRCYC